MSLILLGIPASQARPENDERPEGRSCNATGGESLSGFPLGRDLVIRKEAAEAVDGVVEAVIVRAASDASVAHGAIELPAAEIPGAVVAAHLGLLDEHVFCFANPAAGRAVERVAAEEPQVDPTTLGTERAVVAGAVALRRSLDERDAAFVVGCERHVHLEPPTRGTLTVGGIPHLRGRSQAPVTSTVAA